MGKNQSASNLTNIIKQDASGNITFVSGSTTLMSVSSSGAITTTGNVAGTASYASNAELLDGLDSTVFTLTSSFAAQTASFTAFTSSVNSFTASQLVLNGTYATTGSNTFTGTQVVSGSVLQSGSFTSTGTLTAQTLVVQTITSSVVYSSGSNIFGNAIANSQTFTGSVLITGSLSVNGTSSIVGTGTTNYLPKFTGASTIGNSVIQEASSNIGIGVSPSYKLDVNGATQFRDDIRFSTTNSSIGYTDAIRFVELGVSTRMTLSSGNLGLGVTPSNAYADSRTFEFGAGGILWTEQATSVYNSVAFGSNFYYNSIGDLKYKNSGVAASRYFQYQGSHIWNTAGVAPSAGAAITFTQAMTLDASGNLGLGITADNPIGNGGTYRNLLVGNGAGYGVFQGISTATATNSTIVAFSGGTTGASANKNGGSINLELDGTSTSRAIGRWVFYTNSATAFEERMRITSGGNVCIGATSSINGGRFFVQSTTQAAEFYANTTSNDACMYVEKSSNDSSTSQIYIRFLHNSGSVGAGQINGNGASAAAFGSYSDERLKENITDLPSQLSNILALRAVEFDYIDLEGGGHQIGFIAQEMEKIYPDVVGKRDDDMLTVTGWSKTEARLVKAIQELNTKLDAANAEIEALKSK